MDISHLQESLWSSSRHQAMKRTILSQAPTASVPGAVQRRRARNPQVAGIAAAVARPGDIFIKRLEDF